MQTPACEMTLGYRGHPDWRDMSEFVVHFTKASDDRCALDSLCAILGDAEVRPSGPFGWAKGLVALGDTQKAACFSEIPLDLLDRLISRRSLYGIGFHQSVLLGRGGGRVWYVDRHSRVGSALNTRLMNEVGQWGSELWAFTTFIDQPYDDQTGAYRFEWEREWRVPRGLAFDLDDVAFVFAPEQEHGYISDYHAQYLGRDIGALGPVLIDPRWPEGQLQDAFGEVP